jgi:hypothetical protein
MIEDCFEMLGQRGYVSKTLEYLLRRYRMVLVGW